MAGNQEVVAKIEQALNVAAQCSAAETSDRYAILSSQLQALESSTKRALQSHANSDALLAKLQKGGTLTADDVSMLRTLIVGDADYYLKYDDDFDRSKNELVKILDEIRQLQSAELDAAAMMHLAVLCREACSLLVPTIYYLTQKERVSRFEEATQGRIASDAGRALADVIRGMTAR